MYSRRVLKAKLNSLRKFAGKLMKNKPSAITGLTGFDSIDLCKCKHVVRWIISTLI
jgi:hypothetical protein